jgi:hypothetical protein
MESETTKEDCIPSNENSDDDFDNSSLSSSDEVYKSKSGKKLKRTPQSDLDSTNWDHLENFTLSTHSW